MRKLISISMVGLLLTAQATAGFSVFETGPINSVGYQGDAGNGVFSYNYAGADFVPGTLVFSGDALSGDVGSWLSELSFAVTNPAGQTGTISGFGASSSWTGTTAIGPLTIGGLNNVFTGTSVGTWTFEAFESYDDSGTDAIWSNLSFDIADYVVPTPNQWPGEVEDFETGVPPAGWTSIANNAETWQTGTTAYDGVQSAVCFYDSTYSGTQDEWMLSPMATATAGMNLSGQTMGSIYWGTPTSQGGTFDNYDVEAWIIRGGVVGDGDDTLIGTLDDNWAASYEWAGFSYDLDGMLALGEDFQIGFRYYGYDGAQGNIDAVLLTPEPASLFLLGLVGFALRRRR
ncbi:MAG: PEP-CTERM sorting domain-containing protein [Phycisphaerae bacterium]|nr:PEP-CTERM sorting domain-containing protein [Phycisphaerae bacterium]